MKSQKNKFFSVHFQLFIINKMSEEKKTSEGKF
jgi:hypothetical protein